MLIGKKNENGKMDYETYQPCFYENETETLSHSLPNEDMWKKFELLPTPPLSPRRDDEYDVNSLDMEDFNLIFDEFFEKESENPKIITYSETPPNLNSNLIQDCMWSGDSGRYPTGDKNAVCSDVNSSDCVDPAAVFPYPMHSLNSIHSETKFHSLGTETPSDSEEEIDVVTVEKKQLQQVPVVQAKKTVFTVQSVKTERVEVNDDKLGAAKTTVTVKVKVDCPTDEHPYSLPVSSLKRVRSLPNSPSMSPLPSKRCKRELTDRDMKKVCHKLRASGSSSASSSRNSSDSEDYPEGKRTQHNVLERKRRNDLKFSFFSLRDSVPELIKQERAPKVQILKKASEYIRKLSSDERKLESEREMLQEKHEQLRRTLEKLHAREF
ncbi:transcriptional regulator Myc-A-like isoform X2 [Ostrea edulis]|uniref:transcriptional regulator Myc-A-like isoform X2 n=1 Tax=Ostrea edulis TaxID=37623 RepID=UPI0020949EF5|nr:transcriptional regulator Myc-A-like isoform X2 [Ostrea edulis]